MAATGEESPRGSNSKSTVRSNVSTQEFGWSVRLDHKFPEQWSPFKFPRAKQIPPLFMLGVRGLKFSVARHREGKRAWIDMLNLPPNTQAYGVPMGGLGCGTIGRGWKGEFCRFQLLPGLYTWKTVKANQFIVTVRRDGRTIYQQVLSTKKGVAPPLSSWNWSYSGSQAHYRALYPRSWTTYTLPGQNIRLNCKQMSPVMPDNYKESSYPCAVFVWTADNDNEYDVDVSITFTFRNGTGDAKDSIDECSIHPFSHSDDAVKGLAINQTLRRNLKCTFGVASKQTSTNKVTYDIFDPTKNGKELWNNLLGAGSLPSDDDVCSRWRQRHVAVAVTTQFKVSANSKGDDEQTFSLSWHMPEIKFADEGVAYRRWYSQWFSSGWEGAGELCDRALTNYAEWDEEISEWQRPVLENKSLPLWYKSALFNETYYLSDGGSVWVQLTDDQLAGFSQSAAAHIKEFGRFAYLESHEYRMYNTYDVHFYSSFSLCKLWPQLQLSIQYDFAETVERELTDTVQFFLHGERGKRKVTHCIPHDLGDPEEEPWVKINAYTVHDTSCWRDLNVKFPLQMFRDYVVTLNLQYLRDLYPTARILMDHSLQYDCDDDGMIENSGGPDQTYDTLPMTGTSAYCGSLWLGALRVMVEAAKILEDASSMETYQSLLERAKKAFEEKLWNGTYYNYDCGAESYHSSIMPDQLAGHWYLRACGIDDVFPKEHVSSALKVIYEQNVMKFRNGTAGAVNAMRPTGKPETFAVQGEEVWVGVVYALASLMIYEDMPQEAFKTASGCYKTVYEKAGLGFQTPEAYLVGWKKFRAAGYMRPLSVWAMQHALERS